MKKILVIEDDDAIRSRIVDVLELEGDNFSVFIAHNGREGVEIATREVPDLIISDVMMPELDGYGALEALRANPLTALIPFIILSAKADRDHVREGMLSGADDYIAKPFSLDELLNAVRIQLTKRERHREQSENKINELRMRLATTLPHEFRTPLSGIIGFAELLRDYQSLDEAAVSVAVEQIRTNAIRLQRLTENFITYAQLELTMFDAEQRSELYRSVTAMADDAIMRACVRKAADYGRDDVVVACEPVTLTLSPQYLTKITEELVDNALKFSESGSGVRVQGIMEGAHYALIVEDHGRGMTAEQIANIGPYIQFERSTYEQQGSGLGLALVRRIVSLYEGKFELSSEPDKGTTVKLHLLMAF